MLLGLAASPLTGCYVTRMAVHHNDLFNSRRPVESVLEDPETPPKTRESLLLVHKIMKYAESQGLNTHGAYRYLIETKEPVVSYIVQAAEADRLEFYTWWFPVVGSVPYTGYFEKSERDEKANELRKSGYDVSVGAAGAFSSLGWFEDPIFSSMLKRGEPDLAHLFLHELTHRTLWVPGSTEFNENLAEYVATTLTVRYLTGHHDEKALKQYEAKRGDKILFCDWLKTLKTALTEFYAKAQPLPREEFKRKKAAIFERFQKAPLKPKFQVVDYVQGEEWNNASVLGSSLYAPDLGRFAKAHACYGHDKPVSAFLAELKLRGDAGADPFATLDGMCAQAHARVGG